MPEKALIMRIIGQKGSHVAELLLDKGCGVHGLIGRTSTINTGRIDPLYIGPHEQGARLFLSRIAPFKYHFAKQSHVSVSVDEPECTRGKRGVGASRWLDAIRMIGLDRHYLRTGEVDSLIADPFKAERLLGWKPQGVPPELDRPTIRADIGSFS